MVTQIGVMHCDTKTPVFRGIVVEADLVDDPEADEEADGHAGGEPDDIDGGIAFVTAKVAPGEEEIVFEHALSFRYSRTIARKVPLFLHFNNQLVAII